MASTRDVREDPITKPQKTAISRHQSSPAIVRNGSCQQPILLFGRQKDAKARTHRLSSDSTRTNAIRRS